jgi:hypothetical protein
VTSIGFLSEGGSKAMEEAVESARGKGPIAALYIADSDEVARAIRDDVARDYEMMSPGPAPRWHRYFWRWQGGGQA